MKQRFSNTDNRQHRAIIPERRETHEVSLSTAPILSGESLGGLTETRTQSSETERPRQLEFVRQIIGEKRTAQREKKRLLGSVGGLPLKSQLHIKKQSVDGKEPLEGAHRTILRAREGCEQLTLPTDRVDKTHNT